MKKLGTSANRLATSRSKVVALGPSQLPISLGRHSFPRCRYLRELLALLLAYPRPAAHDAFTMSMMTPVSMRASR